MHQRISLLLLFLCLSAAAGAQSTGTIRGFVYEKGSGEPIINTNVIVEGRNIGVQTDVNGYFSIPQLEPGTYTIFTTLIGYDTARVTLNVKAGQILSQKLFISQRGVELGGVEVTGRKTEKLTQIGIGVTSITPREMKLMPSTGGEPDIAQYLQVVPGVIFTGDQGGQLYIRGGSPAQTGILLDGITIYNPFHSIGLYSVFETDAIRNVEVHSAGFSAQYGNRTSAILDVRTKDGNKNRLSGKVSISPIMARIMLEGPLSKPKTEGAASTTFLLSAKHSYLDKTSTALYGGFGEPFKTGLPYAFTDLYGKISFNGTNGSKLNLFGFNFNDRARVISPVTKMETADFSWNAVGVGTTFIVTPNSSSSLISGRFAYSNYLMDFNEVGKTPRSSGIDGFEGAIEFSYFFPGYSTLKYGLEVSGQHTSLNYSNQFDQVITLDRRNTSAAVYALFRKNFGEKFIFEPSFRVQYYSNINKVSPEPRLGMKYNITENVRLKAAGGLYSQNIISTKSDRDIVNFFTGFLLSPDQEVLDTKGDPLPSTLQTAYHGVAGIEVDIQNVELNLEPWYKNFNRSIELNRDKAVPEDNDFQGGSGEAYGIDLSAKYNKNRVYLWGTVSYQKIEYTTLVNGAEQVFPAPFDRRINVNLLGSYNAGKKKDYEFSLRYNLGSPFPFTQTQGFYEQLNPLQNGLNTNVTQQNGQLGIIYANELNGGRLSYYHRMDVSAKKRFELSTYSNIELLLSVSNVYNRNNIFYIERAQNTRVFQLPIFPSLSVTWNF